MSITVGIAYDARRFRHGATVDPVSARLISTRKSQLSILLATGTGSAGGGTTQRRRRKEETQLILLFLVSVIMRRGACHQSCVLAYLLFAKNKAAAKAKAANMNNNAEYLKNLYGSVDLLNAGESRTAGLNRPAGRAAASRNRAGVSVAAAKRIVACKRAASGASDDNNGMAKTHVFSSHRHIASFFRRITMPPLASRDRAWIGSDKQHHRGAHATLRMSPVNARRRRRWIGSRYMGNIRCWKDAQRWRSDWHHRMLRSMRLLPGFGWRHRLLIVPAATPHSRWRSFCAISVFVDYSGCFGYHRCGVFTHFFGVLPKQKTARHYRAPGAFALFAVASL